MLLMLFIVVGVAIALVASGYVGEDPKQPLTAGGVTATVSVTVAAGTPTVSSVSSTEILDPGIATHIALLTATPQPIATKPSDATAQVPTPDPNAPLDPPLVAGLSELKQAPFSAAEFEVKNRWQGPVNSTTRWMMVWAGAKKNIETGRGVGPAAVRIFEFQTTSNGRYDGNLLELGIFIAPTSSGPLTVVSVNDVLVELRTEGGEDIQFNLEALVFE